MGQVKKLIRFDNNPANSIQVTLITRRRRGQGVKVKMGEDYVTGMTVPVIEGQSGKSKVHYSIL